MQLQFGFTKGDAILITGAASGIGRAVALEAARQGLTIGAWDLAKENLETVAAEIKEIAPDVTVHIEVADVSDNDAVAQAMQRTVEALGPIRMLHNNAGPGPTVPLGFVEALEVCMGSMQAVTEAWAANRPDNDSSMVLTASIAGTKLGTASNWYDSAKAGLMGYVRHLTAYRSGEFRSNAVAPGMTHTPLVAPFAQSPEGQKVLERIPLKRMASPADIAHAVLFLLSPAASYVNGTLLVVDGGRTLTQ